ncbi:hypothetical protein QQ045_005739 [Rhodiola kirilowii]
MSDMGTIALLYRNTHLDNHTLCGFFCAVLAADESHSSLRPGSRCHIFSDGTFRSESGVVLSAIERDSTRRKPRLDHPNASVVHQVCVLVNNKCLRIAGTVLRVHYCDRRRQARALLLVDVYLPNEICSGWQFLKSASTAAAFFRHLSCDWTKRNSILSNVDMKQAISETIWNVPDCHVFECKLHLDETSRTSLFELHEIFKSLPSISSSTDWMPVSSAVKAADASLSCRLAELSDDLMVKILTELGPEDLTSISATCRHLRLLTVSVMPNMKLKLYPHQRAAVEWMLHREQNSDILPHPLYMHFCSEDGLDFHVCGVTGKIVTSEIPTIRDFRGGMFCDEPGLGKTITALSLILKTRGTLAVPPDGVKVIWSTYNKKQRCGYYELQNGNPVRFEVGVGITIVGNKSRRGQLSLDEVTPTNEYECSTKKSKSILPHNGFSSDVNATLKASIRCRSARSLGRIKRNIFLDYDDSSDVSNEREKGNNSRRRKRSAKRTSPAKLVHECKKHKQNHGDKSEQNDTWIQCDLCRKWRKHPPPIASDANEAWFCSMNTNPLYQSCGDPEESWDHSDLITEFPGFHSKETAGCRDENVSFFTSVLKDHYTCMDLPTKKALKWFAKLSESQLSEMETVGLVHPVDVSIIDANGYFEIFQSFGFIKRVLKGTIRWFYPQTLDNLVFDLAALRIALCAPMDSRRVYLSRATLIVVPPNLVDHWTIQIQKHVRPGQLKVYIWTDQKKPFAHDLAWKYDVVLTTFNRLSAEWGNRNACALMQIHWLRIMLDEGHTLGSSLNLTNKLQMAISLQASSRWILTGTPTPNTPNSQVSHLRPLLAFLHEEAFGKCQKSWEAGILRPFESKMEEGRTRLLQLLHRCMISARKTDLRTIPPCIKNVTFVNFTEEHAKSYNELVVTVRRNILMADWNDPSHVESLLNPKQWKSRISTIRNIRLSCCVAGHIKVSGAGGDIQETMDLLVEDGLDSISEEYAFIKNNLLYGGHCMRCKEWCRLPVITPCRHLLCLDCVALDSEKCAFPGCDKSYEMQTPEELARPENPNPKWPVPKDLIELQPSYKQDNWDPDWQSTSSSKVRYLIKRLKALRDTKRNVHSTGDGSKLDLGIESFQHSQLTTLNPILLHESPIQSDEYLMHVSEKVIIFSQFLEHIHVIEQQLRVAGISFVGLYSPMHSCNKIKSLATFQHDNSCMTLLMDGTAALGLDLSFVTHVFLMEPIWDRSMEEQVISRAHRMGATRPINVETLAMKGTIEEQMLHFLQDDDACRRMVTQESGKPSADGIRPRRTLHDFAESYYLAQLSCVRKTPTS